MPKSTGGPRWPPNASAFLMDLFDKKKLKTDPTQDDLDEAYDNARSNRGDFANSPFWTNKLKSKGDDVTDADVTAYFVTKNKFITKYAEIAKEAKANMTPVGTESGGDDDYANTHETELSSLEKNIQKLTVGESSGFDITLASLCSSKYPRSSDYDDQVEQQMVACSPLSGFDVSCQYGRW